MSHSANKLDNLLLSNEENLINLQATITDARELGADFWQASIILLEEPSEQGDEVVDANKDSYEIDDNESTPNDLTTLNLFIDYENDNDELTARFTIDFDVHCVGVEERSSFEANKTTKQKDVENWFKSERKIFDVPDEIVPCAIEFIKQAMPLISSI